MLRFTIYAPDSIVVVDNAVAVVSLAALPANVVVVAFQADQGSIEYNDRPNLRTPFTDPSPYQSFLNLWTTAAAAQTPALLLTQAKQLKKDLVKAIFDHKRRLPYTHGSGRVYDVGDEAIAMMTLTMHNTMVANNNSSAASINSWSATNSFNWGAICSIPQAGGGTALTAMYGGPSGLGVYSGGFIQGPGPGYGGFLNSDGGSINWQPIGSADPIAISGAEITAVLVGVVSRRNALNNNRVDKQTAIDALSTIPAVAAYDATTGWAF